MEWCYKEVAGENGSEAREGVFMRICSNCRSSVKMSADADVMAMIAGLSEVEEWRRMVGAGTKYFATLIP
jgi:hypothetical protein